MKRKFIPADESFARWKKDPRFVAAYNALEAEFALAASLIKARSEADFEPPIPRIGRAVA